MRLFVLLSLLLFLLLPSFSSFYLIVIASFVVVHAVYNLRFKAATIRRSLLELLAHVIVVVVLLLEHQVRSVFRDYFNFMLCEWLVRLLILYYMFVVAFSFF